MPFADSEVQPLQTPHGQPQRTEPTRGADGRYVSPPPVPTLEGQEQAKVGQTRETPERGSEVFIRVAGEGRWVSAREAAEGFQRQQDYTLKTSTLAARERQLEEREQRLQATERMQQSATGFGTRSADPTARVQEQPVPAQRASPRSPYDFDSDDEFYAARLRDEIAPLRQEIEQLRQEQASLRPLAREQAEQREISRIQQRLPDFDPKAIERELDRIGIEEGADAQRQLMNPQGWEVLHWRLKQVAPSQGGLPQGQVQPAGGVRMETPTGLQNRSSPADFRGATQNPQIPPVVLTTAGGNRDAMVNVARLVDAADQELRRRREGG